MRVARWGWRDGGGDAHRPGRPPDRGIWQKGPGGAGGTGTLTPTAGGGPRTAALSKRVRRGVAARVAVARSAFGPHFFRLEPDLAGRRKLCAPEPTFSRCRPPPDPETEVMPVG